MYKYHFTLDEVLKLTQPQIEILQNNLKKILEAENPKVDEAGNIVEEDKPNKPKKDSNTMAFEEEVKWLKKITGKESFTLDEIGNRKATLLKYGIDVNAVEKGLRAKDNEIPIKR